MAAAESPWVLELSSGTFRCGFAAQDLVSGFFRLPCESAPYEAQLAGHGRQVSTPGALVAALDWAAEATGAGEPAQITVVVPSGCELRQMREMARELFESGRAEKLLLIHAASAHAVGAGVGSAVVVDAGRSGTDISFASPHAVVTKTSRTELDWSGDQLTSRVRERLEAKIGSPVAEATAASVKEAFASLAGGDPAAATPFVLPDGTELAPDTWASEVGSVADLSWAAVAPAAADAVARALEAEGDAMAKEHPVVLLTGAASRLPGLATRIAADVATRIGREVRVVRSATAEKNGFLGGFFLSATSMYGSKLAMSKDRYEEEGIRHIMLGTGGRVV